MALVILHFSVVVFIMIFGKRLINKFLKNYSEEYKQKRWRYLKLYALFLSMLSLFVFVFMIIFENII